ncbi:Clp1/GlmU family protein [Thermogladius sp. 4427co]|uniref:Clp1/GlmU family protein n=1 Tax=Thermogladius sp. 4427co TaxID=3450718 RepID=UPI003F7AAEA7
MPVLKLARGEGVKLFGPLMLTVRDGVVEILGKKIGRGESIIIHRLKSYALLAVEDSELDLNLVNEAQIKKLEDNEPYLQWVSLIDSILETRPRVVVIVGDIDSGKSSMSTLILNKAIEKGMSPALVDADVGQADVAPPGYVSLAYPQAQVLWNRSLKPARMVFIGDIKPQRKTDAIIYSVKELVEEALSSNRYPVVVDTDGWMREVPAVLYKFRLIVALKPQFVIHIGEPPSALGILERIGVRVITTPSPRVKKVRDRPERREYRSDRYREFFANAGIVKYNLSEVLFLDFPILQGSRVDISNKAVYSSILAGKYFVVARSEPKKLFEELSAKLGEDKVIVYPQGFEKGLYVSLVDGSRECPGMVERIDFDQNILYVRTPCIDLRASIIKASNIRLTEDFREEYIET